MSKHFKTSLVRDTYSGRTNRLNGPSTADIDKIRAAYQESDFHYQFVDHRGNPTSRVMNCSKLGELEFIERVVNQGSRRVIIQRNCRQRPVYYYDPAFVATEAQPAH